MSAGHLPESTSPRDEFTSFRPVVMGTRHMVSAGHYLAAQAGMQVLEGGGNAVDAGVAAGIALGVLQSDIVSFAGVAPILLYLADRAEVVAIAGVGVWPRAAGREIFDREHAGCIPEGLLRTVVPAAPQAWITALERYGTLGFGEAASAAIRFAREGFPMHAFMSERLKEAAEDYRRWPSSAAIFLPRGRPPEAGELFVQSDLGAALQYMADQERAARKRHRRAGLQAARDAFYRGDIAARIVKHHTENGGLLSAADLAEFQISVEAPQRTQFREAQVFSCGPWCQGAVLLQALNLLEAYDLRGLGHNSPRYLHLLTEAMKLAFADRECYYGDPRFVDVPVGVLLSKGYAARRRALIREDQAWPGLPPAGEVQGGQRPEAPRSRGSSGTDRGCNGWGTSYACVVDRFGNAFSATPSDLSRDTPVIPGTGLAVSSRGSQSRLHPHHPACLAPGKRPRVTPSPGLVLQAPRACMPFGTPGGDVQPQAMLQFFLNLFEFGMDLQQAVEAARVVSSSFPDSFAPHPYFPGRLNLEGRIHRETGGRLEVMGHRVVWWPDWTWRAGGVCAIRVDPHTGVLSGGADPRRPCYAVGT